MQLILRFYGNPGEIHGNFDFVHCMNYYEHVPPAGGKITINPKALESLLSKQLQYHGSLYPVSSVIRTRKFIERGWKINAGQYLKMMLQISELDLTNPVVLEEQLTGVDTWYFAALVTSLREADPEKVNATYIGAIIDRIF